MVSLPDGEKISKISLFVLVQLTNVSDAQTDGRTPGDSIYRAYAYASRGNKTIVKAGRRYVYYTWDFPDVKLCVAALIR